MKQKFFLYIPALLSLVFIGNICAAQLKFSVISVSSAMNSRAGAGTQSAASSSASYNVSPYANSNLYYVPVPAYTTSVQIYYGVPGAIFLDWLVIRRDALALLDYAPGSGNNADYFNSDIPMLRSLAFNPYVNPSAYGSRAIQINLQQWSGQLDWYSSTAGGGQYIKDHILWFMPIKGKLMMTIK